jgi:hypothetical protein
MTIIILTPLYRMLLIPPMMKMVMMMTTARTPVEMMWTLTRRMLIIWKYKL